MKTMSMHEPPIVVGTVVEASLKPNVHEIMEGSILVCGYI
jgi:hypothetical protein